MSKSSSPAPAVKPDPFTRIVGPVQLDHDEDGLFGMGWFIPYQDTEHLGSDLLWHVFPCQSKDRLPTRDHAVKAREELLSQRGSVCIDDWKTFLAVCQLVKAAKSAGRN